MRKSTIWLVAVLTALVVAVPAVAITNGQPDNGEHPFVGTILFRQPEGLFSCSGTLLSPTVMLSAGHCTESGGVTNLASWVWMDEVVDVDALVNRDRTKYPTIDDFLNDPANGWIKATAVPHPRLRRLRRLPEHPRRGASSGLSTGVSLAEYGELPTLGQFDGLKGKPEDRRFEVVGYGVQRIVPKKDAQDDWRRYKGDTTLTGTNSSLTDGYNFKFTNAPGKGTGGSGTCFGDSGGPCTLGRDQHRRGRDVVRYHAALHRASTSAIEWTSPRRWTSSPRTSLHSPSTAKRAGSQRLPPVHGPRLHSIAMAGTTDVDKLWGGETDKAVANFPVSGEPIPASVARWLGRIKAAAARVNAELGLLDADIAERIAAAGDRVAAGELDDQFPIDVFQTGSGTSSNTNANEVLAALAGDGVHPNDHVNMGQSSNDVFPSAVHLAALDQVVNDLLPALALLAESLERKAHRVRRHRQVGPHAHDGRRPGDARPGVRGLCGPGAPGDRADRGCAAAARADPARRHRDGHGPEHAPRVRRRVFVPLSRSRPG